MTIPEYYNLKLDSDPGVIGVKNGIAQIELDEKKYSDKKYLNDIRDFFSGINWWDRDPVPSINIEFYAKKIKGVILTDFLSFSPFFIACPFIINNAVFSVLQNFNISNYYSFPAYIFEKDKLINEDYRLFYMPLLGNEVIDFEKSVFYTGGGYRPKKYHPLQSEREFSDLQKTDLVSIETLAFNKKLNTDLDLFRPRLGSLYVSNRLRREFEQQNFIGIKIHEAVDPGLEFYLK